MQPHLAVVTGIDPKLTEEFLLSQPEVIDASVWYTRGKLVAQVCVIDGTSLEIDTLQEACRDELGERQAPRHIELVRVRRTAA